MCVFVHVGILTGFVLMGMLCSALVTLGLGVAASRLMARHIHTRIACKHNPVYTSSQIAIAPYNTYLLQEVDS